MEKLQNKANYKISFLMTFVEPKDDLHFSPKHDLSYLVKHQPNFLFKLAKIYSIEVS